MTRKSTSCQTYSCYWSGLSYPVNLDGIDLCLNAQILQSHLFWNEFRSDRVIKMKKSKMLVCRFELCSPCPVNHVHPGAHYLMKKLDRQECLIVFAYTKLTELKRVRSHFSFVKSVRFVVQSISNTSRVRKLRFHKLFHWCHKHRILKVNLRIAWAALIDCKFALGVESA